MFAEDLAPFFTTDGFAVTASALNGQGQAVTFGAIFDGATEPHLAGIVSDPSPRVTCRSADVAAVAWASGITVDGTAYTVATIAPDGTGVTTLSLREA